MVTVVREGATLIGSLRTLVDVLPVDDAAAASLGAPFDIETLAATSPRAAACEEASLDLGEGPAWDAYASGHPVMMNSDARGDVARWPFLTASPTLRGVSAVLSLPLVFGALRIGAVSFYSPRRIHFSSAQLDRAQSSAAELGQAVVSRALDEAQGGVAEREELLSRREVHQATGMVIAQTGSSPAEALLRIRAHAFSTSLSVHDVSIEILARRMDFSEHNARDEEG